jgi:hypothetical protein
MAIMSLYGIDMMELGELYTLMELKPEEVSMWLKIQFWCRLFGVAICYMWIVHMDC